MTSPSASRIASSTGASPSLKTHFPSLGESLQAKQDIHPCTLSRRYRSKTCTSAPSDSTPFAASRTRVPVFMLTRGLALITTIFFMSSSCLKLCYKRFNRLSVKVRLESYPASPVQWVADQRNVPSICFLPIQENPYRSILSKGAEHWDPDPGCSSLWSEFTQSP